MHPATVCGVRETCSTCMAEPGTGMSPGNGVKKIIKSNFFKLTLLLDYFSTSYQQGTSFQRTPGSIPGLLS